MILRFAGGGGGVTRPGDLFSAVFVSALGGKEGVVVLEIDLSSPGIVLLLFVTVAGFKLMNPLSVEFIAESVTLGCPSFNVSHQPSPTIQPKLTMVKTNKFLFLIL